MKHRICENEDGLCKIQHRCNRIKILGITVRKEKWIDGIYHPVKRIATTWGTPLFKTKKEAERTYKTFPQYFTPINNKWKIIKELNEN